MASCEMCGRETRLAKAKVEGTLLDVCEQCARFGEIVSMPRAMSREMPQARQAAVPKRKEIVEMISSDYAQKIKAKREKFGLTQEEFAKKLNEKISVMQKLESGQMKPSIELARKLERALGIEIVEQYGDEGGEAPIGSGQRKKEDGFTLGDFIKTRKK